MLLLAGTLSTGFVSCSSSDDVTPSPLVTEEQQTTLEQAESASKANAQKTEMGKIISNYLDAVIKPTYQDLANKADVLYKTCQNLYQKRKAGTLTQNDIDAIGNRAKHSFMVPLPITKSTHISTLGLSTIAN